MNAESGPIAQNSWRETLLSWSIMSAVGGSLVFWLWGRTGEILLDFGNELYTSWQLSMGRVLYRDVQSIYGPLPPNFNALMMRLFGPGLDTVLLANLLILIAVVVLLYPLLRAIAGTWIATAALCFYLVVFALSSPIPMANYNFLTPYAHAITHGFLLCIASIWCVDWLYRTGSIPAVIAGGFLAGATFLTKPEITIAGSAAFFLGIPAAMWIRRDRRIVKVAVAALAASMAPVLITWAIYCLWLPPSVALGSITGGWQYLNKPFVKATPFYVSQLGTDNIRDSLLRIALYAGLYVALGTLLYAFAQIAAKLAAKRKILVAVFGTLLALATCTSILYIGNHCDSFWPNAARGFPVFAITALIATGDRLIRRRSPEGRRAVLEWTFAVLSLALLTKIFFNVRVYHYGFVLAAPCGLLAVVALLKWFPSLVRLRGNATIIARIGAMGVLAAIMIEHIRLTNSSLRQHSLPIPLAFGGTAYVDPASNNAADAIQWLRSHPGTVAVLPDAAGINYAAGRENPTGYTVLNPMHLAIAGESNVLQNFQRNPPDFILIVTFDEGAFGPRWLGVDYGVDLFRWIRANYQSIGIFQGEPRPIQLCRRVQSSLQ